MRLSAIALALLSLAWTAPPPERSAAGRLRLLRLNNSPFDTYTGGSRKDPAWLRAHLWRMVVFSPYFDDKLSWFPAADMYKDMYSIDPHGPVAARFPEWILRDPSGRPLYIPWGCSNGTCPQYAADIANPEFRRAWIADATASLRRGYLGLFVDDVNMEFRVGDGNGNFVAPIDSTTRAPMTYDAWRSYVAQFTEEIRAAFPNAEIIHNSIWFAGPEGIKDRDPFIQRQIAAADYQYIEYGVNDAGLTGGAGQWSFETLLGHIDQVHAANRGVILGGIPADPTAAEYAAASYLLISSGADALASVAATPDNWWAGYDADLGAPLGGRSAWHGVLYRVYAGGLALVNPPQSPALTVALPGGYRHVDGSPAASITLQAAQGAVFRWSGPSARNGRDPLRVGPPPSSTAGRGQGGKARPRTDEGNRPGKPRP